MANLLTVLRVALVFGVVAVWSQEGSWAGGWLDLSMVPLLAWAIYMDALDGWVARRRNEVTEAGALVDIAGDRIVELSLWTFFATQRDAAGQFLVPLVVPVAMVTRSVLTDLVRSVAFKHGRTPFGAASLQTAGWSYQLTASRWSRAAYGGLKAVCFCALGLLITGSDGTPAAVRMAIDGLVALTVVFSLLRAVPVLWDGRQYLFPGLVGSEARAGVPIRDRTHGAPLRRVPLLCATLMVASVASACERRSIVEPSPGTRARALAAGAAPERPIRGQCETTFEVLGPAGGGTRFLVTGTCRMSHLGRTELVIDQIAFFNPDLSSRIVGTAVYTAANGDRLVTQSESIGMPASETLAVFTGTQEVVPELSTGRFEGATGTLAVGGGYADFATLRGRYDLAGGIRY